MENQALEWKETWRDEYMKTLCAFANANGGTLELGRDDEGLVVGLDNTAYLLENLPNKIKNAMAIVADVSAYDEGGKEYITVTVGAYPFPISYHGVYYLRSGSTTQELTGSALDAFMLRKQGKTWDGVPVPYVNVGDFYHDAFDIFRKKAVSSERLRQEDVDGSDAELLQRLKLTEGEYLLRAAPMVFHQDPERWCVGSYVKIGYFANNIDLLYQDEIGGPLITVPDRVMDIIFTKYFKGLIRYEGIQRIDRYPMPHDVLREAVLNAVVHKDYSTGNPIHIRIYDDKVVMYNSCLLPQNVSLEGLLGGTVSMPHNPLIANAFFRSGQIETWGRGIEKMIDGCLSDGLPKPEFDISPRIFSVCFHIRNNNKAIAERDANTEKDTVNGADNTDRDGEKFGEKFGENQTQVKIIEMMTAMPNVSAKAIAAELGITLRAVEKSIRSLREQGCLRRVGASKGGRWEVIR